MKLKVDLVRVLFALFHRVALAHVERVLCYYAREVEGEFQKVLNKRNELLLQASHFLEQTLV